MNFAVIVAGETVGMGENGRRDDLHCGGEACGPA